MFGHGGKSQLLSPGSSGATPGSSPGARDQLATREPAAPQPFAPLSSRPRPVLLATLSVQIDPTAERLAIDAACETGATLIIANLLTLPPYPATIMLAREYATLPHEEARDAVRATARRATDEGVATELLRISSRRPLQAMLELARERDAGLLVLGPDARRTPRWLRRLAAARVRRRAPCLVWIAPPGAGSS